MRFLVFSLALLSSGCPALMSAALEGGEVEDHEPRPPTTKSTASPLGTGTPTPTPTPTPGAVDTATYTLVVGEAVSATNPRISRTTTTISKGSYVAMKFETSAEAFGMDGVDVSLYVLEGGSRTLATQRRSPLKPTDDVLYKSWQIKARGSFLIEVKSPAGKTLATGTFQVV
jgi:hypothetical protein